MNEALQGVRRFHEQDVEIKKRFYTRDASRPVVYNSNFDLYTSPTANWRDTFISFMAPSPPPPEELPEVVETFNRVLKSSAETRRLIVSVDLRGLRSKTKLLGRSGL
ncbi:putative isopenicillin N synthase [Helianthus annuus]|nr:putative isopenicillin N synthase [Helianthus annuus]